MSFEEIDLRGIQMLEPATGLGPDVEQKIVVFEWGGLRAAAATGWKMGTMVSTIFCKSAVNCEVSLPPMTSWTMT